VSEAQFVLISGALLAAGVLASSLAARVRVPALVLLLVVGKRMHLDTPGLYPVLSLATLMLALDWSAQPAPTARKPRRQQRL
jgi:NhaP-type Na+/H+ and K+/H+ antiporter